MVTSGLVKTSVVDVVLLSPGRRLGKVMGKSMRGSFVDVDVLVSFVLGSVVLPVSGDVVVVCTGLVVVVGDSVSCGTYVEVVDPSVLSGVDVSVSLVESVTVFCSVVSVVPVSVGEVAPCSVVEVVSSPGSPRERLISINGGLPVAAVEIVSQKASCLLFWQTKSLTCFLNSGFCTFFNTGCGWCGSGSGGFFLCYSGSCHF